MQENNANRYFKCPEDSGVYSVFVDLIENRFPRLEGYSFGFLFDTKKKARHGRLVLAQIALPGELLKYFATDKKGNPFDFIIIMDAVAWDSADEDDRKRLISHELRHVFVDEKGNPKLVGHDMEDFYDEISLNRDDPEWCRNLCEIVLAEYDQRKESALSKKAASRKQGRKAPPLSQWPSNRTPRREEGNPSQVSL